MFVLANPSGAQARYQLPELVAQLAVLRDAVSAPGDVVGPPSSRARP